VACLLQPSGLMRRWSVLLLALLSTAAFARGGASGHPRSVYVHGYTTKRGTYVAPHRRAAADSRKSNNWSHVGNVNPYTGKDGTKQ
jgi:hypothetical protein